MGIGHYSEQDVKEAARAFTGWQAGPGGFFFNARQHDYGLKTVLGKSGNFNGNDIVAMLVGHPATARRLSSKLARFFVSEDPSPSIVEAGAQAYLQSKFQIKQVVRAILKHPDFLSERAYHAHIKSPAELVVGCLKTFQVQKLDADLPHVMARMGQDLFEPPNVKGWDGGPAWISTDTMMERFNFAARITGQRFDELESNLSASQLVYNQKLSNAGQVVDYFLGLLVDGDVPAPVRARLVAYVSSDLRGNAIKTIPDDTSLDTKLRGLVRLIMTLPAYQLA